jgi:uncharacterized membrane protein
MTAPDTPDRPAKVNDQEAPAEGAPDSTRRSPRGRRRRRATSEDKPTSQRGVGRFFLRGLVTLAPVALTVVVFGLLFQMVNRYVTRPINNVIYWSLEKNSLGWDALARLDIDPFDYDNLNPATLPLDLQDELRANAEGYASPAFINALALYRAENDSFFRDFETLCIDQRKVRDKVENVVHPLIGVFLSILVVLWMGWVVSGFLGRRIVARLDHAMHVIPVVKSVYPHTKQLVEFFFAERKIKFDTVVCIPYPSPGIWSLGFVTSSALKTLREATGDRLVGIFIPSSPMPMTGYTIFIAYERLVPLSISVDEALRITMTGGVLVPTCEQVDDPFMDDWDLTLPVIEDAPGKSPGKNPAKNIKSFTVEDREKPEPSEASSTPPEERAEGDDE